jgi:transcriptional regulator with PAS, ATPase and Fis domain
MPGPESPPEPGVVVLWAGGRPATAAFDVTPSGLEVGRGTPPGLLDDDRVSRRHARIARNGEHWLIEDLGSRNGTFVDGRFLEGMQTFASPVVVRIGRTLLWAVDDVRPFRGVAPPMGEGLIVGGASSRAFGEIALAARAGDTVFILGETGSGKEMGARAFHEARYGPSSDAPFVAVNCAAIPEGLAERLLFGARKGSYSGATADAEGYVQSAHGGTLFLDEIAELDPLVQAKLLRVLETREVLPLGALRPKRVDIVVCTASHRSLRDEVAQRRFREDLYFRIGRPEVRLPPLRDRLDEIPWFIERTLRVVDERLSASAVFVEVCALRPWPGNARELIREVRRAAQVALEAGASAVEAEHLSANAGISLTSAGAPGESGPTEKDERKVATMPADHEIRRALDENGGNVRGTARSLGIHRNQLRRWLEKQK